MCVFHVFLNCANGTKMRKTYIKASEAKVLIKLQ